VKFWINHTSFLMILFLVHLSQLHKKFCAGLPRIVALLLDVLVIIVMSLLQLLLLVPIASVL